MAAFLETRVHIGLARPGKTLFVFLQLGLAELGVLAHLLHAKRRPMLANLDALRACDWLAAVAASITGRQNENDNSGTEQDTR